MSALCYAEDCVTSHEGSGVSRANQANDCRGCDEAGGMWFRGEGVTVVGAWLSRHLACCGGSVSLLCLKAMAWPGRTVSCSCTHSYRVAGVLSKHPLPISEIKTLITTVCCASFPPHRALSEVATPPCPAQAPCHCERERGRAGDQEALVL